jgi:hypothetical protein
VPAGFVESKPLEPAASYVARKPVAVQCASSVASWTEWVASNGGSSANGSAQPGDTVMYLSPQVCSYLRGWQRGRPVALVSLGPSLLVLTHEAVHLRGLSDEGTVDCDATHEMVAVAQRFFGIRSRATMHELMADVARYRQLEPAVYRTVC